MSHIPTRLGFIVCLMGALGAAHYPQSGSAVMHVSLAGGHVSIATRAFDLGRLTASDFGDLEPVSN